MSSAKIFTQHAISADNTLMFFSFLSQKYVVYNILMKIPFQFTWKRKWPIWRYEIVIYFGWEKNASDDFDWYIKVNVYLDYHIYPKYSDTSTPCRPRWLSWMRRPTGDQEVTGSTPAEVGNILSWRLIMKYFLRSFSPFRWFKKGSCQFLAKECAQYWLTA